MGKRINTAVWEEKQQRWKIHVQRDGRRKSFYSCKPGRTGQREANAKADAWLDEGVDNTNVKAERLYDEYVGEKKATTSQSNWRQLESIGTNWLKPAFGHKKIGSVTEHDLQIPINKAMAAGLSKKTLKNILNAETSFIKYCRTRKCCTLLPENVTIPKSAKYNGKNVMQPHDLIKLFNCTDSIYRGKVMFDSYVYAYRFQVSTGLRPGELIGLQWKNLKGTTLHVRRAINQFGEVTSGKNENARRNIELTKDEVAILEAQKELSPVSPENSIFQITTLQGYEKRWERFRNHNGISRVSPYELRHTFVSINKALPAGYLKDVVGHAKDMDTYGIYSHHIDGDESQLAKSRADIMNKILKKG